MHSHLKEFNLNIWCLSDYSVVQKGDVVGIWEMTKNPSMEMFAYNLICMLNSRRF